MTSRFFFLLAVAFTSWIMIASPAMAGDASLSGRVTDSNGEPLPGANVVITGPSLSDPVGTVAGADGSYTISGLAAGRFVLEVSYIGYREAVVADLEVSSGKSSQFDVSLEELVIYLEQSVVSASRTQEKALDAPASVAVVEGAEIRDKPVLSVAEHVRDLPGVDYAKNGLVQSNVVVRGFNNIFSGAMLTLTDNRLARVPSLRLNAHNFIPVVNEDIERIEVVLGPGSALYGPNSANGVMHIVTRSPFTSAGTNVQYGMGERSVRKGAFRHAGIITPTLGYKISAQYFTGTDWKYDDPAEVAARTANPALKERDFDVERQSVEARVDYRPNQDLSAVVAYGYNQSDLIELTGLGAGQGINWTYNYAQARVQYRNLFAQVFRNWSDAGDTFLLNSGIRIVDQSALNVFQIQHAYDLNSKQRFTYGVDALLTRPNTGGTITGRNEDDDDLNEYGAYLQSETDLMEQLRFVLALRYDQHNRLDDGVLSPRAGLVYKLQESQTLRLTYNRAFDTPTSNTMYLDLVARPDVYGIGSLFSESLGFSPTVDLATQGTYRGGYEGGFTFRRSNGHPMYRSSFEPVFQKQLSAFGLSPGDAGYPIDNDGYISMHDPTASGLMWGIGRTTVLQQLQPAQPLLAGLIAQQAVALGAEAETAQAQGDALAAFVLQEGLPSMVPQQLAGLTNSMLILDPTTATFAPIDDAYDVPRTEPTITQTIELGYKGIVAKNFVFAADAYRTDIEDFVGPLRVETPNVFLDPGSVSSALAPALAAALADPENEASAQVLGALDQVSIPDVSEGNGNGSAVDELTAIFVSGVAQIPFGTVSPEQAYDREAVLMTYRNYGDITLYGLDLSAAYYPSDQWTISGNYSLVNKDIFKDLDIGTGVADLALNAPKHKAKISTSYKMPEWNLRFGGRVRYNGGFPQNSGVWAGNVDSYTVVDLNTVYDLPFGEGLSLTVNIDNVLDTSYRSFIGAPKLGRLSYMQLGLAF